MLEHRTPLDSVREDQGHSGTAIERLDLHVISIRDKGLLLLQSASVAAFQEALSDVLGLTLPSPQEAAVLNGCALLWLTPAEWLLELPADKTDTVEIALSHRLGSSLAVVTELSDALVELEVSGSGAPETLMTGCSLDMRPFSFRAGRVVRTALAGVPAIVWNPGNPDRFRCLIDRGFAEHFLAWLQGAMPQ
jgi:heterotetrameric sarcosine oxidase gamma subunit